MALDGGLLKRGRPFKSGKFSGRPTKVMRVPADKIEEISALLHGEPLTLPLYSSKVRAGFPSPAEDFIEGHIDLHKHLVKLLAVEQIRV